MQKTAVIVVHGVCPHPRYEIQDVFATQLAAAFNGAPGEHPRWTTGVMWPAVRSGVDPTAVRATALRIYEDGDNLESPQNNVYDIFEGYWSPIDKNQTSVPRVLMWLLHSLFEPLTGHAKLWAPVAKVIFDLGYLTISLGFVVALLVGFVLFAASAWNAYAFIVICKNLVGCQTPNLTALFFQPWLTISALGPRGIEVLAITAAGAYCLWIFLFSLYTDLKPDDDRSKRASWRRVAQAALLIAGAICFYIVIAVYPIRPGEQASAWRPALYVVLSIGLLKSALAFMQGFLINFLGDVQIYCTHDENARFYELRERIIDVVETTLLDVLRTSSPESDELPYYDRVFIAAHSLGSTIAMDAIINVHELVEEGGLPVDRWRRLRGLLTFGSALEKTRFFFDVRNPSLSASFRQWRDDVFGHLFTSSDVNVSPVAPGVELPPPGIYWANYWYFTDLVANRIESYRSNIAPGAPIVQSAGRQTRTICINVRLSSKFLRPFYKLWVHGDYLGDPAFWTSGTDHAGRAYRGVADIIR